MPLLKDHGCVFVHIPKTGGTSIEKALGMFGNWQDEDRENLFGLIQSTELLEKNYLSDFLQHLNFQEIIKLNPEVENYHSFSFVRNPWDRMVSIYHNIDANLSIEALKNNIDLSKLSFDEFLIALRDFKHIHLQEQWMFLFDESLNSFVDYIGRFENIAADFNDICESVGIEATLDHYNKSNHNNYRNYYTNQTRNFIADWYKKDIELFSYEF